MRYLYALMTAMILALAATSCGTDDPKITFYDHEVTYTIGTDYRLIVDIDGASLTDTKSAVKVSFGDDGHIATLTLISVVPGHGEVAIGALNITSTADGHGIAFEGKMAISETEAIAFSGTIIGTVLTLNIVTVPIPGT